MQGAGSLPWSSPCIQLQFSGSKTLQVSEGAGSTILLCGAPASPAL